MEIGKLLKKISSSFAFYIFLMTYGSNLAFGLTLDQSIGLGIILLGFFSLVFKIFAPHEMK